MQSLPILDRSQVAELLSNASGDVSYIFDSGFSGTKSTAKVVNGQWTMKTSASKFMEDLLAQERLAQPKPPLPVATGSRSLPYAGPFPRKRHSHRCLNCGGNPVACYKTQCTKAQTTSTCVYCRSLATFR